MSGCRCVYVSLLCVLKNKANGGLPAGLDEVQAIERAREKQNFEMNLPEGRDKASFEVFILKQNKNEKKEWESPSGAFVKNINQVICLLNYAASLAGRNTQITRTTVNLTC